MPRASSPVSNFPESRLTPDRGRTVQHRLGLGVDYDGGADGPSDDDDDYYEAYGSDEDM